MRALPDPVALQVRPVADVAVPPLVLASASPRRRELLDAMGFDFEVAPSGADETVPRGSTPERAAEVLAIRKARAVARRRPDALVLGADTLVVVGGRVLGKAASASQARAYLRRLSGSVHRVVTGVALVGGGVEVVAHASTEVEMRPLAAAEIAAYAASGEWRGKAGAYAIQETADRFVVALRGSRSNVVGLPTELVDRLLRARGIAPGPARGG